MHNKFLFRVFVAVAIATMFVINSSSFLNPALSKSSHQSKPPTDIASGASLTAASPNSPASIATSASSNSVVNSNAKDKYRYVVRTAVINLGLSHALQWEASYIIPSAYRAPQI